MPTNEYIVGEPQKAFWKNPLLLAAVIALALLLVFAVTYGKPSATRSPVYPSTNSITTTNTILPANTTPLHNKTTTTTTTAPTTTSTSTTSTSTTTTTAPASTSTIPSNTVNASAEPNTIPPAAVTTYLLIPIRAAPTIKFSYIPIETTNTIQILYLCKYIPYVYQNPLYQTDHIGQSFASIYTLRGQYEFADLGRVMADSDNTTPGWLTAYCN